MKKNEKKNEKNEKKIEINFFFIFESSRLIILATNKSTTN